MENYKVELSAFVTRFYGSNFRTLLSTKHIKVQAIDYKDAANKAILEFIRIEESNSRCVDSGTPSIDSIKNINTGDISEPPTCTWMWSDTYSQVVFLDEE
jgi:hypothetical protein